MHIKPGDKLTLNIVGGLQKEIEVHSISSFFMWFKERGSEEIQAQHIETVESIDLGWQS